MAKKSTSEALIKSIHRNVKPAWYGMVFAVHMQDPTISSELKALIALVSTCNRSDRGKPWEWRSEWMRGRLNWGRDRWQRVMREARTRGFVTVQKVSHGEGKIGTAYEWNIDPPKAASEADSSRRLDFPSDDKVVRRQTRLHNHVVKGNEEVKNNEEGKRKQGITDVMAPFKPSQQNQSAKTELIPEESWQRLTEYLDTELPAVEWREPKRDNGALRALWAISSDEDEIIAAIEEAASVHVHADGIFGMAVGLLKQQQDRERASA